MSNFLEDITYEDVPQEYKTDVNNGKLTQEEALRTHKEDLFDSWRADRDRDSALEMMQMPR